MNTSEIRKFFDILKDNRKLTEVRILDRRKTFSGYFTSVDTMLEQLKRYDNFNIYFTLNAINPACASRSQSNIIQESPSSTTSDNDIIQRDWVLIDIDPKRPSDTNATDAEKKLALEVGRNVYRYLESIGFPKAVVADSGNGYHLLYKTELPNNERTKLLIKDFLQSLSTLFDTEEVSIDTSVFNAGRICKLYGTSSRKGIDSFERPQRESCIVTIPDKIHITSEELIKRVADFLPKPETENRYNNYQRESFDIDGFIRRNRLQHTETNINGVRKIVLEECPFDSNHKAPDSAIFVLPSGAIGFKCFHNSCQGHTWRDVREKFEPRAFRDYNREFKPINPNMGQSTMQGEKVLRMADKGVKTDSQNGQNPDAPQKEILEFKEIEYTDRSKMITIPSKLTELDKRIMGFNLGEISLWSGSNASGKSTILGQLALSAVDVGFKGIIFSGELTAPRVKNWIHQQAAGRNYTKKSNKGEYYYTPKDTGDLIDAWLEGKLFVYNNDMGNTAKKIFETIRKEVHARGLNFIVLDNLMAMDILLYEGDTNAKQKAAMLDLTTLAKELNIHIHLVAHPRKSMGFLRKNDISGTSDITNIVDNTFIIHRCNLDFFRLGKDFFGDAIIQRFEGCGNVVEVCKNRDLGIMDELIGLHYELESRRFLNSRGDNWSYGWIPKQTYMDFEDLPPDDVPDMPLGTDFDN